jgi:hypothetical protein
MDHLPVPIDGYRPRVTCYALDRDYKPEDFFNLPRDEYKYHDTLDLLENGLRNNMTKDKVNEFLQSWLWFALIAQVLGQTIKRKDFQWGSNEISTVSLPGLIQKWTESEQQDAALVESQDVQFKWNESEDEEDTQGVSRTQKNRYLRASMAIEQARRFVSKHCSHKRIVRNRPPNRNEPQPVADAQAIDKRLDSKLILSIAILGETLQQARPRLLSLNHGKLSFFRDHESEDTNWGYNPFCRDQMKKKGCCPLQIRRRESALPSVSIVYYSCFIERIAGTIHSSKCDEWACQSKGKRLDPLHMNSCDKLSRHCPQYEVNDRESKVMDIIKQGKLPLVKFTHGKLELQGYAPKELSHRFGVLSHSWEEAIVHSGFDQREGERNNRKMHVCQIEALQNTFNKLLLQDTRTAPRNDVPFYVDVLCMPVQPSNRATAINQLKYIYRDASAVLVWDRNLLERDKPHDLIEVNMRIRTGDWFTRMWTFQELVLARKGKLHIAFKNEATVSVSDIQKERNSLKVCNDPFQPRRFIWRAGHPFSKAISEIRNQQRPDLLVQRVWEAVQYREIENREDETIVLANVLGLNVTDVQEVGDDNDDVETKSNKRMAKLLQLLDNTPGLGIPSGIIFLPPPKLSIPGLGWAPSTWLTKQQRPYPLFRPLKRTATIMKDGLLVQFPGIVLHCPTKIVSEPRFWFPVHQSMHKWYKVRAYTETIDMDWAHFWKTEVSCPQCAEPAIIMCNGDMRDKWEAGVLVKSQGFLRQGEIRRVEFLCRVSIRLETNPGKIQELISRWHKHDEVIFGERLDDQQEWCVGGKFDNDAHSC